MGVRSQLHHLATLWPRPSPASPRTKWVEKIHSKKTRGEKEKEKNDGENLMLHDFFRFYRAQGAHGAKCPWNSAGVGHTK